MTSAITVESSYMYTKAYLTPAEYNASPGHASTLSLVPGGDQAAQDAALLDIIFDATGWVNDMCEQVLCATVDTEEDDIRVDNRGFWTIQTLQWPVLEVQQILVGITPLTLMAAPLENCQVMRNGFRLPAGLGYGMVHGANLAQIQFGAAGFPMNDVLAQYTYVNGWPVATVLGAAESGAAEIDIDDCTGVFPNTTLVLRDNREQITVESISGSTLTLTAPLQNDHVAGAGIDSLPPQVKRATILLTTSLIRNPGIQAIVAGNTQTEGKTQKKDVPGYEDARIARALLRSFRAVR